ncbi:MAG: Family 1 extracellular solute-binding protein [Parcubacteria group bacterium GW2011_GWC1_45_13]|uniref:Family 1 extracellular solute-binding protein n=1 Tax=Candidatus Giovannonibacteria bacterium GW2011_GWA1_44_29 TaxID=1618646 RepID=A0A0G1L3V5_9BACT|nr:MAG: Family 1 extracellular solute-binding protein [Candidatus Giovannonibacteria bacterium GW2011_GWA1_44_29]KKT91243.1 MAG: Family 1 extracellular solute-binding protein [Parcubacteria group bacterium GW2011_GWC1_45_13]
MDKLQIIIIGGAVIIVVIAVLVVTGIVPGLKVGGESGVSLAVWGFDNESALRDLVLKYAEAHQNFDVRYSKKDRANFESDFLNAIARGEAPDIVVFPSDYLNKHKDKLSAAPTILFTEREISQQYIEAASVFLGAKNEVLGVPFYAEPLMLFINNDIFTKNFIASPPKTWDEFLNDAAKFTKKDSSGNIAISGAALGRAENIENAPLILTTLFLQSGEKIINNLGEVVLNEPLNIGGVTLHPAESSLQFITDFANPKKNSQSWSGALPEAKDAFINGELAMYFGKISEHNEIKNKNVHLSFSAALLPQLADTTRPITGGVMFALAVPKASKAQQQAWQFIQFLSSAENSASYADKTGNVSTRRDVLPVYQKESTRSVFANSVLALKLWPDPDPMRTDQIFRTLIEDMAVGRFTLRDSLEKAKARLQEI